MGSLGAANSKEMHDVEIIIAPSIQTEGKVFQVGQRVGMGNRWAMAKTKKRKIIRHKLKKFPIGKHVSIRESKKQAAAAKKPPLEIRIACLSLILDHSIRSSLRGGSVRIKFSARLFL